MKQGLISICRLREELGSQVTCRRVWTTLGCRLSMRSQFASILDLTSLPEDVWTPESEFDGPVHHDCIVAVEPQPDQYIMQMATLAPMRIKHPSMCGCSVFPCTDGMALVQDGRGVLFCTKEGLMVWLLNPNMMHSRNGRMPNIFDMVFIFTNLVLSTAGLLLVHAGGVGRNGQCCLITGCSGAGKTTMTLRMAAKGWGFYGDDLVVVGKDREGVWKVYPFWRPLQVTLDTWGMLPELRRIAWAASCDDEKMSVPVKSLIDARPPIPLPVGRILCLTDPPWEGAARRLSAAEAMSLLGENFLSALTPEQATHNLEQLLELISEVPVSVVSREHQEALLYSEEKAQ